MPRRGSSRALTLQGEAISARSDKVCGTCGRTLQASGDRQRFCSPRCRLLAWAAKELVRAIREGSVEGLRAEFRELTVEVVHAWDGRRPS